MSKLTTKLAPDRSKINLEDPKELKYWKKALKVSKEEIMAAVQKVGSSAAAVRKQLNAAPLSSDDFPLNADGRVIRRPDGAAVAAAPDPAVAEEIAERLNGDEARREEDKWSA
jgi:hypothetical protein